MDPHQTVLPEAPPPSHRLRQRTTHDRRRNNRQRFHTRHQTRKHGALIQRQNMRDDSKTASQTAREAQTCHGSPDNEHRGRGSSGAEQGADEENDVAEQKNDLDREMLIQFREPELERAGAQAKCRGVPAHVGNGVKVVGDARHGCSDDVGIKTPENHDHA